MINADEARDRGIGCYRGVLVALGLMALVAILLYLGIRAAH